MDQVHSKVYSYRISCMGGRFYTYCPSMTEEIAVTIANKLKLIKAQEILSKIPEPHSNRESLTIVQVLLKKLIEELYAEIEELEGDLN